MRANPARYELRAAASLDDVLATMANEPGAWTPLAGGTDLMVTYAAGQLPPGRYLSIWGIEALTGIHVADDYLTLGALTTYSQIRESDVLCAEFPSLAQAAMETGGIAIQNRGTLGGNIANGSPAADSPPALVAYGADIELISSKGARWVAYGEFHTGYKQSVRRPQELISRIRLPRLRGEWRHYYRKVGTRRAQAISKVVVAAAARIDGDSIAEVRIGVGSVAPTVLRCRATEAALAGGLVDSASMAGARRAIEAEIAPIDDIRSTAVFRRKVAGNVLVEFLRGLASDDQR